MAEAGRRHGFQCPLDPLQVASWLLFAAIVASTYVLYAPVATPQAVAAALGALYAFPALVTWVMAARCQLIDPIAATDAMGEQRFCIICERWVKHRSRHCSRCRKCVETYDHHCPWLNNCVGAANYRSFIGLVVSMLVLTTLHLALLLHVGLQLLADPAADGPVGRNLAATRLGLSVTAYGVILAVLGAVMALVWQQLSWLLCLHYLLHLKGYTTDEYFNQVFRKNEPPPRLCLFLCRRLCRPRRPPSRKVGPGPSGV